MIEWRLRRPNDSTADSALLGGTFVDALNRFARKADLVVDDADNDKESEYPKFEPIELEYRRPLDGETSYTRRFGGFVADSTRKDEVLEIAALSYDQFLRGQPISRAFSSTTIENALQELIQEDTSVGWAGGANVTLANNPTITRVYEGEQLQAVLDELATIAADGAGPHEWGATDTNEFFIRPRGNSTSPRDFSPGSFWGLEIERKGREFVTEAQVYYGQDSKDTVKVVERGDTIEKLEDRLGLSDFSDPITKNYPQIDNQEAAERKARDLLRKNDELTVYSFSTYDGARIRPGDIAQLRHIERDVDRPVRVAQLEYDLAAGTVEPTAADNRRGTPQLLARLSEEISRLDARGRDNESPTDQFQSHTAAIILGTTGQVETDQAEPADEYSPPAAETAALDLVSAASLASGDAVEVLLEPRDDGNRTVVDTF